MKFIQKKNNSYILKVLETEKNISNLQNQSNLENIKQIEIDELIKNALELTQKIRLKTDFILKFIRGTINYTSVFSLSELKNEFENNFINLLIKFEIDKKYIEIIHNNIVEILICILTLLHDSKFEFYDKNSARVYLCLYFDHNNGIDYNKEDNLYENSVLSLYVNYTFNNKTHSFPLFVSDILIKKHIIKKEFIEENLKSTICEIPWITAKRLDNQLILKKYS